MVTISSSIDTTEYVDGLEPKLDALQVAMNGNTAAVNALAAAMLQPAASYNNQGNAEVKGTTSKIFKEEYHSFAFAVVSGRAKVEINGVVIDNLPTGHSQSFTATGILQHPITLTGEQNTSRIIVNYVKKS